MLTRLQALQKGHTVRVKGDSWKTKGRVISGARPRSYVVKTEKDSVIRRNQQHLLATREPFISTSEDDASDEASDNEDPSRGQMPQAGTNMAAQGLRRSTRDRKPLE
ncbi:hypothetical protein MRX96_057135 [Rhipicephalus microplus]|uniref:Uncharacterized protein n=2 Tax=Rhipicephalus microplus TaxID=6941 RepID=A0A9J6EJ54_RHIMP|nr:hypothetical protein HPB51_019280 [Rhipicephalus microplus]